MYIPVRMACAYLQLYHPTKSHILYCMSIFETKDSLRSFWEAWPLHLFVPKLQTCSCLQRKHIGEGHAHDLWQQISARSLAKVGRRRRSQLESPRWKEQLISRWEKQTWLIGFVWEGARCTEISSFSFLKLMKLGIPYFLELHRLASWVVYTGMHWTHLVHVFETSR